MKYNITTIEGLAEMIQRTMASKEDLHALDKKVQALDMKVTTRFNRIEHLLKRGFFAGPPKRYISAIRLQNGAENHSVNV